MLDLFFRKYVWIANAVLLCLAAWLGARTVNTVVAATLRPRPLVDLSAVPASAPPPLPTALDTDKLYGLFNLKPPKVAEASDPGAAPPPPAQNCFDPHALPVRSTLRAQLVAGVVCERPEWSIASLTDLNTRETRIYGVGDSFQGATVLGVERVADPRDAGTRGFRVVAVVCNGGKKEYVDFEPAEGGAMVAPPPVAALSGEGGTNLDLSGVRKIADNRYDIPKRVIDQTLSNLNNIATQARIVPSFKNGVANGFKLFSIQPGSLYSAIGVENGDVIQRINGYEINSPDKALEIYQKLREASHVTIEIERGSQTVRKDYNISGP